MQVDLGHDNLFKDHFCQIHKFINFINNIVKK